MPKPDLNDVKTQLEITKVEVKSEPQVNIPQSQTLNTANTQSNNTMTSNYNSIFTPVLLSSVEDINKYYKPDLLTRLTGIDLNEVCFFLSIS